jgi:2-polyprenyl-3-methyl-5-hydroxy-6-metoxy-1,4-benzoquinol methylase
MANAWFDYGKANHFWVRHRNAVLDRHFSFWVRRASQICEIGCGNGLILSHLAQQYNRAVDGFELNDKALHLCPPLPGTLYIYNVLQRHPDMVHRYDVLFMMDVLEHIENEVEFLQAVRDHLIENGWLIIGVPMRQHLYSAYDAADGHYRRYSSSYLSSIVQASGFEVKQIVQWGHAYIPLLMLRQWLLQNSSGDEAIRQGFAVSNLVNSVLSIIRYLDFIPTFGIPGASSLLLAQKSTPTN